MKYNFKIFIAQTGFQKEALSRIDLKVLELDEYSS